MPAFTLVETIVVIVVIALLLGLAAFGYQRVTTGAEKRTAHAKAVQFAKAAYGVAATHQSTVSSLVNPDGTHPVDEEAAANDLQVVWGAEVDGARVAGVTYRTWCTPVLFAGGPGKVGDTRRQRYCHTDTGTLDGPVGAIPDPSIPTNLRVTSSPGEDLTLTWEPVTGAATYTLYVNGTVLWTGSDTTATLPALEPGSYQVAVTATTGGEESDRSPEITATVYGDNDAFVNAWPLPVPGPGQTRHTQTVSNTHAGIETGEPDGDNFSWRTLWWTFTAPADGTYTFTIAAPETGTPASEMTLYLFDHPAPAVADLTRLTHVAGLTPGSGHTVNHGMTAGETIYVRAASHRYWNSSTPYPGGSFRIGVSRAPANDWISGAAPLPVPEPGGTELTATVDNRLAGIEDGEPDGNDFSWRTLWWTFTAPADGTYTFTIAAPETGTPASEMTLYLFDHPADTVADLTRLTHVAGLTPGSGHTVNHGMKAGETIYVRAASHRYWNNHTAPYPGGTFRIGVSRAPVNDWLSGAVSLPVPGPGGTELTATVDNRLAGIEDGEPDGNDYSWRTLWWTFKAPADGTYTFTVAEPTDGPRAGEMTLYLFSPGASVTDLTTLASVVGGVPGSNRTVSHGMAAGETLYVRAANYRYWNSSTPYPGGTFRIGVSRAPANDWLSGAVPLPAPAAGTTAYSATADNRLAGIETGEPDGNNYSWRTLWWTFTAPADGTYTFTIAAPETGTPASEMTLYLFDHPATSVSDLETLGSVVGGVPGSNRTVSRDMTAGETIYVRAANYRYWNSSTPYPGGAFRIGVTRN